MHILVTWYKYDQITTNSTNERLKLSFITESANFCGSTLQKADRTIRLASLITHIPQKGCCTGWGPFITLNNNPDNKHYATCAHTGHDRGNLRTCKQPNSEQTQTNEHSNWILQNRVRQTLSVISAKRTKSNQECECQGAHTCRPKPYPPIICYLLKFTVA